MLRTTSLARECSPCGFLQIKHIHLHQKLQRTWGIRVFPNDLPVGIGRRDTLRWNEGVDIPHGQVNPLMHPVTQPKQSGNLEPGIWYNHRTSPPLRVEGTVVMEVSIPAETKKR